MKLTAEDKRLAVKGGIVVAVVVLAVWLLVGF